MPQTGARCAPGAGVPFLSFQVHMLPPFTEVLVMGRAWESVLSHTHTRTCFLLSDKLKYFFCGFSGLAVSKSMWSEVSDCLIHRVLN